jgi:hypothetical protein
VATAFGLTPAVPGVWACAPTVANNAATNINVAASIDLMTNPKVIDW